MTKIKTMTVRTAAAASCTPSGAAWAAPFGAVVRPLAAGALRHGSGLPISGEQVDGLRDDATGLPPRGAPV